MVTASSQITKIGNNRPHIEPPCLDPLGAQTPLPGITPRIPNSQCLNRPLYCCCCKRQRGLITMKERASGSASSSISS